MDTINTSAGPKPGTPRIGAFAWRPSNGHRQEQRALLLESVLRAAAPHKAFKPSTDPYFVDKVCDIFGL
jgi:hypothetical protein